MGTEEKNQGDNCKSLKTSILSLTGILSKRGGTILETRGKNRETGKLDLKTKAEMDEANL